MFEECEKEMPTKLVIWDLKLPYDCCWTSEQLTTQINGSSQLLELNLHSAFLRDPITCPLTVITITGSFCLKSGMKYIIEKSSSKKLYYIHRKNKFLPDKPPTSIFFKFFASNITTVSFPAVGTYLKEKQISPNLFSCNIFATVERSNFNFKFHQIQTLSEKILFQKENI